MLVSQFAQACINGDMTGLMNILADDITMWNDGGGLVNAARNPIYNAEKVSRFLISVTQKLPANFVSQFAVINNQPGFIVYVDSHPVSTIVLEIGRQTAEAEAYIQNIRIVANPEKLRNLPPLRQN
jgi:RNA polymerase sigma-70 factor (ECF subfamily)